MTPFFAVLQVVKVLPQVQVTCVSTYSGWMPLFTSVAPSVSGRRVVLRRSGAREPEPPSSVPEPQPRACIRHSHADGPRLLVGGGGRGTSDGAGAGVSRRRRGRGPGSSSAPA